MPLSSASANTRIYHNNTQALLDSAKRHPFKTAGMLAGGAAVAAAKGVTAWSWKNLRSVDGFDEIASALGIATAELSVFALGTPLVLPGAAGAVEEYTEAVGETRELIDNVRAQNQACDTCHQDMHRYLVQRDPQQHQTLNLLRFKIEDTPPKERNTAMFRRDKQRYERALHTEIKALTTNRDSATRSECRHLLRAVNTQTIYRDDAVKALKDNIHQVRIHWTGAVAMAGMGTSMVVGIAKTAWEVADKATLPAQLGTSLSGLFMGSQILMALYGTVRVSDGIKIDKDLQQQTNDMQAYADKRPLAQLFNADENDAFTMLAQDNKRRRVFNRYGGTVYGAVTAVGQTCMAAGTGLTLGTGGLGAPLATPLFAVGVPLTLLGAAMRSTTEAVFKRYTGNKDQEPEYATYDLPNKEQPETPKARWSLSLRHMFGFKKKPQAWVRHSPPASPTVIPDDTAKPAITRSATPNALKTEAVTTIKSNAQDLVHTKLLSHVRHVMRRPDWSDMRVNERCEAVIARAEQSSTLSPRGNRTTLLKKNREAVVALAKQLRHADNSLRTVLSEDDQTAAHNSLLGQMVNPQGDNTLHGAAFQQLRTKSAEGHKDYAIKFFKSVKKRGARQFFAKKTGLLRVFNPVASLSRSLLPNRFAIDYKLVHKADDIDSEDDTTVSSSSRSDDDARENAYAYLQDNVTPTQEKVHAKISKACLDALLAASKREYKQGLQAGFGTMKLAQRLASA